MAKYRIHYDVSKLDPRGFTSKKTWSTRKAALAALTHGAFRTIGVPRGVVRKVRRNRRK